PDFSNAERDSIVAALSHPRSVVLELVNKAMEKIDRSKIKTPQDLVPALDKVINQLFYDLEGVTDSLKYAGLILEIYDIILKRRSEAQVQNPEVDEHW
ncbi:MAG TPA: hypothetical protein DF383_04180, partial [Deltaproteobacteria bacterium]|nr:hypothetical protein [Deltaproteobacteria bacterium]